MLDFSLVQLLQALLPGAGGEAEVKLGCKLLAAELNVNTQLEAYRRTIGGHRPGQSDLTAHSPVLVADGNHASIRLPADVRVRRQFVL